MDPVLPGQLEHEAVETSFKKGGHVIGHLLTIFHVMLLNSVRIEYYIIFAAMTVLYKSWIKGCNMNGGKMKSKLPLIIVICITLAGCAKRGTLTSVKQ